MLLIIGWIIVSAAIIGGFTYSGGNVFSIFVLVEYIVILGVSSGYAVAASPISILKLLCAKILSAFKGTPFSKVAYLDLIKALYELFMLAREQGMVGIEEHIVSPKESRIFTKYPSFLHNHHAIEFLQDNLRPIIDGKAKADQVKAAMQDQLDRIHDYHNKPIQVLSKLGDAMPGIGIVAAVLGIIITMGSIGGDKAAIGHHVAAALVGTFLGILVSYGFIQPLCINLEFIDYDELCYFEVMSNVITSYAAGAPPIGAAENGRQAIPPDRQPSSEELESTLKELGKKG
jgi:chemotaxis protein MotA